MLEGIAINVQGEEVNDLEIFEDDVLEDAGSEVEEFAGSLPLHIEVEKKRKATGGYSKEKKPKILPDDTSGVDWMLRIESETVHEVTVDKLKKYLRSKGLPLGGNKKAVVERIYTDAGKEMGGGGG